MRVLALDVGTKTIGVAVSDELRITANGLTTLKRTSEARDLEALRGFIDEFKPAVIVVGIPYLDDGGLSKRGEAIVEFAEKIRTTFGIQVEHWDESFSTVAAEKALIEADVSRKKRKKVVDKIAAVIILREYLESLRSSVG